MNDSPNKTLVPVKNRFLNVPVARGGSDSKEKTPGGRFKKGKQGGPGRTPVSSQCIFSFFNYVFLHLPYQNINQYTSAQSTGRGISKSQRRSQISSQVASQMSRDPGGRFITPACNMLYYVFLLIIFYLNNIQRKIALKFQQVN